MPQLKQQFEQAPKARAKYDAWADRKGMSPDSAMKSYVKLVQHLKKA